MCAGAQYRDCSQELEAGRESRIAPIDVMDYSDLFD